MGNLSPGTLILGIFAVLFGLVGAYAAKDYLQKQVPAPVEVAEQKVELISIPMAIQDLPAGRPVAYGDVSSVRVTREQMQDMALPASFISRTGDILGRTLRDPIKRGQAFDPAAFFPEGIGPQVAAQLKIGERGVVIPFEGSPAEAGLITPGASVDVLFRTDKNEDIGVPEATVSLLEGVRVLAVGRGMVEGMVAADEGASKTTVTLAVTSVQARALKVVEDRGSFMLTLRCAEEGLTAGLSAPTTLPELLGMKAPEPPFRTEIYRGGRLSTIQYDSRGQRQMMVIKEPPYGLPVLAQQPRPAVQGQVTQIKYGSAPAPASEPTVGSRSMSTVNDR